MHNLTIMYRNLPITLWNQQWTNKLSRCHLDNSVAKEYAFPFIVVGGLQIPPVFNFRKGHPTVPKGGEQELDWGLFAPLGDDFSLLMLVRRFHDLRSFHQRLLKVGPLRGPEVTCETWIHYFCHNFIYFTFYAAKLQRKSESTKFSPSFLSSRIALQRYGIFSTHSEDSRRFAKIRKKKSKKSCHVCVKARLWCEGMDKEIASILFHAREYFFSKKVS